MDPNALPFDTDPADDGATMQRIFTRIAQHSVIFATLVTLARGALLYAAGDAAAVWCLGLAPVFLAIHQLIGVRGNYALYLGGLLLYLGIVTAYTLLLSMRFGRDSGFLYLMVPIVSILMLNVRLGTAAKWATVAGVIGFMLWHDYSLGSGAEHALPPATVLALRAINGAVTLITVAALTLEHYKIIAVAQNELLHIATTDVLTGLLNRRQLATVAQQAIGQRRRYHRPLSFILADVDHFKKINDTFGHDKGDQVLRGVAHRLSASKRDTDHVGRWGGEEFVAVLPETDLDGALIIAERIRNAVAAQAIPGAGDVGLTLTLGVAEIMESETLDDCLRRADTALRNGKTAGRNRVMRAA